MAKAPLDFVGLDLAQEYVLNQISVTIKQVAGESYETSTCVHNTFQSVCGHLGCFTLAVEPRSHHLSKLLEKVQTLLLLLSDWLPNGIVQSGMGVCGLNVYHVKPSAHEPEELGRLLECTVFLFLAEVIQCGCGRFMRRADGELHVYPFYVRRMKHLVSLYAIFASAPYSMLKSWMK